MPPLDNPRHERFAQALAEGKTADEAYQVAGYRENRHNASRLKTKETIAFRVAEIHQRAAERVELTKADVLARLGRYADAAEAKDTESGYQAARACMADIAKLNGWIVEKKETGAPGDFDRLSDSEIAERLAREATELLAAFGGKEPQGRTEASKPANRRLN